MFVNEDKFTDILSKIDFLKVSEDKQTVTYELDSNITVFQILNIPFLMGKQEVIKRLELTNLIYSRLYKKSLYWILSTNDKETQICAKNTLRELYIDDFKIKAELFNKTQLTKIMRDQVDKNAYNKEIKSLGVDLANPSSSGKRKNSSGSCGSNGSGKGIKADTNSNNSDNFSWRKGSGNAANSSGKNSFDNGGKGYYGGRHKGDYGYGKGGKGFKRNRFNSDYAGNRPPKKNENFHEVKEEEIEIDISKLKYPLTLKYKYSFQEMKECLNKLQNEGAFKEPPKFLSEGLEEILIQDNTKLKEITALDSLINDFDPKEKAKEYKAEIPKSNPIASFPNMFNKFDMVSGNFPSMQPNNGH
ncbi:MAG: hypothetical protein MJ252_24005 [archaeon]|nr:hypothetical protein [archaeon]